MIVKKYVFGSKSFNNFKELKDFCNSLSDEELEIKIESEVTGGELYFTKTPDETVVQFY